MAIFVRVITEDSVLERIAGVAPGMLQHVRCIDAQLSRAISKSRTVEDRDAAEREHMEALLQAGSGAIAVGRLALWEGLRGFNAQYAPASLNAEHDVATSADVMIAVVEAQAHRLYPNVPGVSPALIERENAQHRQRCVRTIEAIRAGVVDAIAWSNEPLSAIQERIEACDILSLP